MTLKARVIPCLDVKDVRVARRRAAARTRNVRKVAGQC
jgi:imidazole glycerol phosphate synthase subunit HisF